MLMDSQLHATESSGIMGKRRFDWVFLGALGIAIAYLLLMFAMIKIFADFHPIKPNYSDIRLYTDPYFKAQTVQQRHYRKAAKLNQYGVQKWVTKHSSRKPQRTP